MGKVNKKNSIKHLQDAVWWMNENLADADKCKSLSKAEHFDVAGAAIKHWKM
jgi:hypothetical protein